MMRTLRARLTLGYTAAVGGLFGAFVVADVLALQDDPEAWRHALLEHGLLGLVATAGVALVSWYVVGRAFRPVQDLVDQARSISAEDLSRRLEAGRGRDELTALVDTFNDLIARLEVSFGQIGRFSADAAHELKTPLSVLRGEIELALRRPREAEDYRRALARIGREVEGMSRIVDNLLFLAREGQTERPFERGAVRLDDVVVRVFEAAQTLAVGRGVRLDLGPLAERELPGDATLLERMVANVVENAIEHSPSGAVVRLALEEDSEGFVLTVDDEGEGIPPSERERVFDRFYRLDRSRSKRTGGAGLGLAIVRDIAARHGCDVAIVDRPGGGTRVRFLCSTAGGRAQKHERPEPGGPGRSRGVEHNGRR